MALEIKAGRIDLPWRVGAGPALPAQVPAPYASFWQAGFEGADHVNGSGTALCMNGLSGHLPRAGEDYARLRALGITTVRESACWRGVERRPGQLDFTDVGIRARAARDEGVQLLWTFMHYGLPQGLDIFSDAFVTRFASYCGALAAYLKPFHAQPCARLYATSTIRSLGVVWRPGCSIRTSATARRPAMR